jgi:ubiquitin carboxyl-terminal hydrolase 4/11/15
MGIVLDVCRELSKYTSVSPEKMVVTDVYNHRFHKVFSPNQGLSQIMDRDDIFV